MLVPVQTAGMVGMMIGGAIGGVTGDRLGRRVALLGSVVAFGLLLGWALKGFGSKLSTAGTVVDAIVTGIDIAHGAPAGEELAQLGGRTLGSVGGGCHALSNALSVAVIQSFHRNSSKEIRPPKRP